MLETEWLIVPLEPSTETVVIGPMMSPATSIVSLPAPPISVVTMCGFVLSTKKWSSPAMPSTTRRSTAVKSTLSPAPSTPSRVMTKLSGPSEPMMLTVSEPPPPSIFTGALIAYSKWSSPAPPLSSDAPAAAWPVAMTRNERTVKLSLPSSPKSLSSPLLEYTWKVSSPPPP